MSVAYQIIDSPEQSKQWQRLIDSESEITGAWLKEGLALQRIRDEELFLLRGYATFADYYRLHLKYHKATVSLRMSAAEVALQVRIDTEKFQPNQIVYRELSSIDESDRQSIIDRACELSVSNNDSRVMQKHVKQAIIESRGGYSEEVLAVARTYGFEGDMDKLQIAQRWHEGALDNPDGKFWMLAGSGVIDPADDKDPVDFASASIEDIARVEIRWQRSKIVADNPNPPIEGLVNEAKLVIDGQNIAQNWQGKRVKITVKVFD